MNPRRWWRAALAIALLAALLVVLNPELRVLLLFVDALGWELLVLMIATQLRALAPCVQFAADHALALACMLISAAACSALRQTSFIVSSRLLLVLLFPVLVLAPHGLRCRAVRTGTS